jgi:hypothetical protein
MGLINQDNRLKRDLANVRTPEDVMRRLADNVKITTDEVKGLTVEVSGKVGNDEIISRINQSAEAVTIDANKININGTISANGNFKVDTQGNMTCNNATINNAKIRNIGRTNSITVGSEESEYQGLVSSVYPAQINLKNHYMSGGAEIIEPEVYLFWEFANETTQLLASGLVTTGQISSVNGVCQGSKAEIKKNFEKLDNALDIVKETDIYKYNLKKEKNTEKKHIGFVIGDKFKYRQEITSKDNEGVDLYSMVSVLWKAVQEQQKEIEELKKVIK